MLALFTITLFLSAWLLFMVQPMFAKFVLPLLGGTPGVWNTCMMFFQATLLAGYLYAHLSTRWLGVRRQAIVHSVVLLLPLVVLPLAIGEQWTPPRETNPVGWLLLLLTASVGLPFFVVATSAPLLQRWFSMTGHTTSNDPYFLYAASNAGSMLALLSYPLFVEPLIWLEAQSRVWSGGYVGLLVLSLLCAVQLWRTMPAGDLRVAPIAAARRAERLPMSRVFRWVLLAFAPSSLMLGVTSYITTDLVVVPLFWVIPLALYLLSFILVFGRRRRVPQMVWVRAMPIAVVALMMMLLSEATQPMPLIVVSHLVAFFVIAMVCHGRLASDRPEVSHLTLFYLAMSVGGLLGGVFNALIAPVMFTTIAEYPIAIIVACLLMPMVFHPAGGGDHEGQASFARRGVVGATWPALLIGMATYGLIMAVDRTGIEPGPVRLGLTIALPVLACYLISRRPIRFGLAVAAVFFAGSFDTVHRGDLLLIERTFFGVHRVTRADLQLSAEERVAFHRLYHGTTLHGQQRIDPLTGEPKMGDRPLSYYHVDSPVASVFASFQEAGRLERIGIVGLGAGSLAAYGEPGQYVTFYEIDPTVMRIAERPELFNFVAEARRRGVEIDIVLGDARLTLSEAESGTFDLLILDAFSSDAIPVHLLTREAVEVYAQKLSPRGVMVIHISNRYLDLEPVVANVAHDLGLVCLIQHDSYREPEETRRTGKENSTWALLSRDVADLQPLLAHPAARRWYVPDVDPAARVWTDQYTNVLRVLRW